MENNYNKYSLEEIKNLPAREKILIVEELWDSIISSKDDIPVSEENKIILDKRLTKLKDKHFRGRNWKDRLE